MDMNNPSEPRMPRVEDLKLLDLMWRYLVALYNDESPHQSLGYRTPRQIYQEGLWICGRSAPPTGCASRASSESGEMLAFDHIPTGATTNTGFNIDEVNSRLIKPAVALTAIGADLETGRATP